MTQIHNSWIFSRYCKTVGAFILCIAMALSLPRALAQAIFGSVNGVVTDPTGAAVPNASDHHH